MVHTVERGGIADIRVGDLRTLGYLLDPDAHVVGRFEVGVHTDIVNLHRTDLSCLVVVILTVWGTTHIVRKLAVTHNNAAYLVGRIARAAGILPYVAVENHAEPHRPCP